VSKNPTTLALGPLEHAAAVFREVGIADPAREVREIFAGVLAVEPVDAWRHRERIEHPRIAEAFGVAVERRRSGEPLAYVIGRCGFRFLDLAVDRSTLIPRPETEGLVSVVLQWAGRRAEGWGTALELGTGSGCIALSLWVEGEFASVMATEISEAALNVAHSNATRAGAAVDFRLGSWFEPVSGERFSMVVSNPPYVSTTDYDRLDPSVREFEPRQALESGERGMDALTHILRAAAAYLEPNGMLALEIDSQHEQETLDVAMAAGWVGATVERDVFDRPRYLIAIKE
jgi:release factor glutamine methyltransferase